ncbi:uncharacterized protein LOC110459553 isoform X2 [Mizuhopecten yessoensis]|uniref:uncharacterized protein LOC110459553 isoform X2 n=1 Tax=Mizuhopecten yessoensis TaxID=6573 RepID=UPI000B457527|nr:uncharacterized protein LOC110459553 isoform X2 [Mizuhopecten yessoensis]
MTEEVATATKTKESAVLKDSSLAILAKEIGQEDLNGLVLTMYLNVPNTDIVNIANGASECGLVDANESLRSETTRKCLIHWKNMRAGVKEREKVKELDRALKELGKAEIADVVSERHSNNADLTPDAFSNLG